MLIDGKPANLCLFFRLEDLGREKRNERMATEIKAYSRWEAQETSVVHHLHGEIALFTVWANGKEKPPTGVPNVISSVPFTGIYSEGLGLS